MEYKCNKCNKNYSSYQSLWIHNKKFHIDDDNHCHQNVILTSTKCQPNVNQASTKCQPIIKCEICSKEFNTRQSKSKHKKKCKENNQIINTNKQIINTNNINNNTNNGIINNNNQQNIVINQIGTELISSLPIKDVIQIITDGNNSTLTCIKKINFNKKLPQNHSFCTTTLAGDHFTKINHKTQKPEKINKKDFINEILLSSLKFMDNISLLIEFDEEFRNKIPLEEQLKIKEILNNRSKFYEARNKRAFFHCINDMSYNFKDLILNTWKLIQPIDSEDSDESGEQLIDPNFNYNSSDSDSD